MKHPAVTLVGIAAFLATPRAFADDAAEVVVAGDRRDPAARRIEPEDTRNMPGAFGDAFRAASVLPGTVQQQSSSPYLIVRGAPPGNTGYLVDGIPVPLLFHLGLGPAVIHPVLAGVDLYTGGAPARFGRQVGGVLTGTTREPSDRTRVHANVRAFDAGGLVETPLAGGKADALAAGRYSYTGAALSLFSPGIDIGYWDYQTRIGVNVSDHDRLSVFAFGSHDHREAIAALPYRFESEFHRVTRAGDAGRTRRSLRDARGGATGDGGGAFGRRSPRRAFPRHT